MEGRLATKIGQLLQPFLDEALPEGGIDIAISRWQKPGRGFGRVFPGGPDVRYLRFLVEALYRIQNITGNEDLGRVANAQVNFMANVVNRSSPTWTLGNALEMVGLRCRYNEPDLALIGNARRIIGLARERRTRIEIDGLFYYHFPCGYGALNAKDAGWTNDLSMFGSGLVWTYEITSENGPLQDAASFAEYFVRPWRPNSLRPEGYWASGTWRESIGSWVIGPLHYRGFESTDLYSDEASWIFSTVTCIDYLTRLYRHVPDVRFLNRSIDAAKWTFRECQFADGAVGVCGKDDKWLGCAGDAIRQVAMLKPFISESPTFLRLVASARKSYNYLCDHILSADVDAHGVEWVTHSTYADPLVNVAMLRLCAILGVLDGAELWQDRT